MLFDVRVLARRGWTVVSVVGDVDLATMPALSQHLSGVDSGDVALDLSGVDHLEPVTFGVVIAASLRTRRRGDEFAVVCPPSRPLELFVESGLDQILRIVADTDHL